MSVSQVAESPYVLATGEQAVRRLHVLHDIYSPAGRRVLLQAGLKHGMNVADFGCGVGAVTCMLAEMVGPSGTVTGIDVNLAQLEQAAELCSQSGLTNTRFIHADACCTGLPRGSFDLVYCRFLLLHLPRPEDCLEEMRAVLRPGGILVVEDGDIASAGSIPPSPMDTYADMFCRLGESRGLDYSLGNNLYHLVARAGFSDVDIEIHQPAIVRGQNRLLLKWSIEEAGPAFLEAGLVTPGELAQALSEMQRITDDPSFVILAPRMSLVWARKQG
jgi:SAM-dependent methyltransferase